MAFEQLVIIRFLPSLYAWQCRGRRWAWSAARTGHALIGARRWIPQEHIEDTVKSLVMGLPY
jgi:hypothetical protein